MKGDAVDRNGVIARKGLWIISRSRGKTYGVIKRVKPDGTIVWKGAWGQDVTTDPNTIYDRGYEFAETPLDDS